jgi:hypothetical protein
MKKIAVRHSRTVQLDHHHNNEVENTNKSAYRNGQQYDFK